MSSDPNKFPNKAPRPIAALHWVVGLLISHKNNVGEVVNEPQVAPAAPVASDGIALQPSTQDIYDLLDLQVLPSAEIFDAITRPDAHDIE